ncbi:transcription factor/nuclear export subunit protein 2-domain-containing protein [Flagelloscypha sp. PMI_526]|nr:transcription factor/nuclear export subunit protein 2-domain-containing protein [Flagelloscypha sp. PMI_526]
MDSLDSVRRFISEWDSGGEVKCRDLVVGLHGRANGRVEALNLAYTALVSETLESFTPSPRLSSTQFVLFVQSVAQQLPSSSTAPSSALGELLLDLTWTLYYSLSSETGAPKKDDILSTFNHAARKSKETLTDIVKQLCHHGIVSREAVGAVHEFNLLGDAGLSTKWEMFSRKEVRNRTNLYFKQKKFNLTREQSEGYSKLTTELTSSLGPPNSSFTGLSTEDAELILARAQPIWERLLSIIGYFDLDPNRVLDIILDVFSVNVDTHHQFFFALLSYSPWYERLPLKPVGEGSSHMDLDEDSEPQSFDQILSNLDPLSPPDPSKRNSGPYIAEIMGFKFTYYELPDVKELPPRNLFLLAALLIREGYITLEELYSHLTPSDDAMKDVHQKYLETVVTRSQGNTMNKLAMAGALEGSDSGRKDPGKTEAKISKRVEIVVYQKMELLDALLSIGALKPALSLLSLHPWIVDVRPSIGDLLLRILRWSIEPLYSSEHARDKEASSYPIPEMLQPRAFYNGSKMVVTERKFYLTTIAPPPPHTKSAEFVWFYPQWTERIPVCRTFSDLRAIAEPLLHFIGVHLSRDVTTIHMYLRLAIAQLKGIPDRDVVTVDDNDREIRALSPVWAHYLDLVRRYFLPALPLIRGNALPTVELWRIIKDFPLHIRWSLYSDWKGMYRSHPELEVRAAQATREAKDILRRLSHDTLDSLSGAVAKLVHTNPLIFFPRAVGQVMAYENMAGVVVSSLRYCGQMDLDILVYCVLDALATDRDAVKEDGVNVSDWLQSLSNFIGMLLKRYPIDTTPLLSFLTHRLNESAVTEVVVLSDIIRHMAAIEPLPSLTDSQILAMSGGPVLRTEAVASSTRGARLTSDSGGKVSERLRDGLIKNGLGRPLLIQVAQRREDCVFIQDGATSLKPLAGLFDTIHGILFQYIELLSNTSVITLQDYIDHILPESLSDLFTLYSISPPICMLLIRPVIRDSILRTAVAAAKEEKALKEAAAAEQEQLLKAKLKAKAQGELASKAPSAETKEGEGSKTEQRNPNPEKLETEDVKLEDKQSQERPTELTGTEASVSELAMEIDPPSQPLPSPWLPELENLFEHVKEMLPETAYKLIGPGFYTTFWELTLYDLNVPVARYEEELSQLRRWSVDEDKEASKLERLRRSGAQAHKNRRDRYNLFIDRITGEMKEQVDARGITRKRIAKEKAHWFTHPDCDTTTVVDALFEHCFLPRCLLSPMDADFCAQFIRAIHKEGTPNFHTLRLYNSILDKRIGVILASCTEYEAKNFGRFLSSLLADLERWRTDEQAYVIDNRSRAPGPGKDNFNPGFRKTLKSALLSWKDVRTVMNKWHLCLKDVFVNCIRTGKFIHVYNSIIVLKELLPVFPLFDVAGLAGPYLYMELKQFLEKEDRGDLKVIARAYIAGLEKRRSFWEKPRVSGGLPPKPVPSAPRTTSGLPSASSATPSEKRVATAPPSAPAAQRPPSNAPSAPRADAEKNAPAGPRPDRAPFAPNISRPAVVKRVNRSENASPRPVQPKGSIDPTVPNGDKQSQTGNPKSTAQDIKTGTEPLPMPPPAEPSTTDSSNALREIAKQSRHDKDGSLSRNASRPSSPRRRSPSPSRNGKRSSSNDSRASGSRRTDREKEKERKDDDRRHTDGPSRRDSLTHDRDRRNKDREDDRDRRRGEKERGDQRDSRDKDRHRIGRDDKDTPKRDRDRSALDGERGHKRQRDSEEEDPDRLSKRGSGRGARDVRDLKDSRRDEGRRGGKGRDDDRIDSGDRRGPPPSMSRQPPTEPRRRPLDSPPGQRRGGGGGDSYTPSQNQNGPAPRHSDISGTNSLMSRLSMTGDQTSSGHDHGRKRPPEDRLDRDNETKRVRLDRQRSEPGRSNNLNNAAARHLLDTKNSSPRSGGGSRDGPSRRGGRQ